MGEGEGVKGLMRLLAAGGQVVERRPLLRRLVWLKPFVMNGLYVGH